VDGIDSFLDDGLDLTFVEVENLGKEVVEANGFVHDSGFDVLDLL
jgi:hypothetical protein